MLSPTPQESLFNVLPQNSEEKKKIFCISVLQVIQHKKMTQTPFFFHMTDILSRKLHSAKQELLKRFYPRDRRGSERGQTPAFLWLENFKHYLWKWQQMSYSGSLKKKKKFTMKSRNGKRVPVLIRQQYLAPCLGQKGHQMGVAGSFFLPFWNLKHLLFDSNWDAFAYVSLLSSWQQL